METVWSLGARVPLGGFARGSGPPASSVAGTPSRVSVCRWPLAFGTGVAARGFVRERMGGLVSHAFILERNSKHLSLDLRSPRLLADGGAIYRKGDFKG